MTQFLQHLASILLTAALLLPLLGERATAAPGEVIQAREAHGLSLAKQRLGESLGATQALGEQRSNPAGNDLRICTTACAHGPDAQGQTRNFCVTTCNDGSREESVSELRGLSLLN